MTQNTLHSLAAFRRRFFSIATSVVVVATAGTLAQSVFAQSSGMSAREEAATSKWTKLTNQPPFHTDTGLLLTDGTVMMHEYGDSNWWRLTPDINGSYLNGTWSQLAAMSSNYGPLYFASAVLKDGTVLVEGGEYNHLQQVETTLGAFYNPVANTWTNVNPPSGWSTIGDAPCVVLQDGTFMLGQAGSYTTNMVYFNESTLTWTAITNNGKADPFVEEGFGILPSGMVLTVDCEDGTNSELYNPATKKWTSAGSTVVGLPDKNSLEIGPQMQRPDGTVVAFGAQPHSAIYTPSTGTWAAGPNFPGSNDMADAPDSLIPDGNVLCYTSPGVFQGSGSFYIFDGTTFAAAPATARSGSLQSWQGRMLLLPTGEILWVNADGGTTDAELFTSPGKVSQAWAPKIKKVPKTLVRGSTVKISGAQFNGLSMGSDYGDDATMATNYPIVRLTNKATKHVFYARTHDHSTMGISTGSAIVSTMVDIPANAETGASTIQVVANGIASKPKAVTVQ
ncbi:MAG TPA: hypothetical protein VGG02_00685 [Chthoniobacterales bacterium]|jgi:hypothetical protein